MMRNTITFTVLFAFGASCFAQSEAGDGQVKDITPNALSVMLVRSGLSVIDVNEEDNYAAAHVPGAKRLEYDAITTDVLPADKTTTLVFYCWSTECPAAYMAAHTASSLGYIDVYCMRVGITGWQDADLPTEH